MIKNIFFDFDGVIADSVNVKTEAFRKLYISYGPEISDKVVEHHLENGGMSRFEKFRHYHLEFLGQEIDEKKVDELANQFSDLVMQGVIDSPEVKGSHDFLKQNNEQIKMFVITGTPTEESRQICKERGIYDCFIGIHGSPEKKTYWSNLLLEKYELKSTETIFVGDALADYTAAMNTNLKFYLRETPENESLFKDIKEIERFNDFLDFRKLINK